MKRRHALVLMAMVLAVLAGCNGESWSSGDRVLVSKFLYDSHLKDPRRYDVVVFKFPQKPLKDKVPTNYIKRLLGLPGELLAIFFGRIYRCDDEPSEELRRQFVEQSKVDDKGNPVNPLDLWEKSYQHRDDEGALKLFHDGRYKILRKPPATMLAMRRIVFDNDHQAKDLQGVLPPRWSAAPEDWSSDQANGFRNAGKAGADVAWLRYQHILRPEGRPLDRHIPDTDKLPQLIRDFSGYNSYVLRPVLGSERERESHPEPPNWVGDLMLEFELIVDRPDGELWVELARGVDRFPARFNLQTGDCTLFRVGPGGKRQELAAAKTSIHKAGTYKVRYANFDDRLTLWIDRELPFGDGAAYDPAGQQGPTDNDLKPALIGSKAAAVQIHHLKLWRDTYYTSVLSTTDAKEELKASSWNDPEFWSNPKRWQPLPKIRPTTLFVQPGHYLCLGDNSPESSDGRDWGSVPERLMLGRALTVYWPVNRAGAIE